MAAEFAIDIVVKAKDQASAVVNSIMRGANRGRGRGGTGGTGNGRTRGPRENMPGMTDTVSAVNQIAGVSKAIVGAPIELAANFESAINRVNALSGGAFGMEGAEEGGTRLDAISKKARELGASTEFTAYQAAEAFQTLTQAGLSYEQQLSTVSTVLDFATVGQVSMAKSADLITAAMGGFGLEGPAAAKRVGDSISRVANSTQANVSDVGATFRKVAPIAKTLGFEIENVGVAIAVLGKGAIRGGEAGNALKGIFASLATIKGDRGKLALKALGLDKKQLRAALQSGDMKNVLTMFAEGFAKKGLGGAKRVAILDALVGKYHFGKLDQLIQSVEVSPEAQGSWDMLNGKVSDASVTLNKNAEIIRTGTKAEGIKLQSAMEELGITIGEKLLPTLTPLIVDAQNAAYAFAKWAENNQDLVRSIGKVLMVLAAAGTVLGPVLLTFMSFKTLLMLSGGGARMLGGALPGATGAMTKFGAAAQLAGLLLAGVALGAFIKDLYSAETALLRTKAAADKIGGDSKRGTQVGSNLSKQMTPEEKAEYEAGKSEYVSAFSEMQAYDASFGGAAKRQLGGLLGGEPVEYTAMQERMAAAKARMDSAHTAASDRINGGGYEYTSDYAGSGEKQNIATLEGVARQTLAGAQALANLGKNGKNKLVVEIKADKGIEAKIAEMQQAENLALEAMAGVNPEGY